MPSAKPNFTEARRRRTHYSRKAPSAPSGAWNLLAAIVALGAYRPPEKPRPGMQGSSGNIITVRSKPGTPGISAKMHGPIFGILRLILMLALLGIGIAAVLSR